MLNVRFQDERRASLSLASEGLTEEDLSGIRIMLSVRTGKALGTRSQGRPVGAVIGKSGPETRSGVHSPIGR